MLFTYEEFMNHYNIRLNFIEYFSILSAIPHRWKRLIRGIGKLNLIETIWAGSRRVDYRLSTNFSCFNSDKLKKTSFQNGLTFSAIFSKPSLLKNNILLPPHFCI
jgi:hypothetical protein